jgi:hypothetical protein
LLVGEYRFLILEQLVHGGGPSVSRAKEKATDNWRSRAWLRDLWRIAFEKELKRKRFPKWFSKEFDPAIRDLFERSKVRKEHPLF